jgi:hypothetical protein
MAVHEPPGPSFGHSFVQAHRIDIGAVALSRLFGAGRLRPTCTGQPDGCL